MVAWPCLLFVFHDLSIEFVHQQIDRGIKVGVSRFDMDFALMTGELSLLLGDLLLALDGEKVADG